MRVQVHIIQPKQRVERVNQLPLSLLRLFAPRLAFFGTLRSFHLSDVTPVLCMHDTSKVTVQTTNYENSLLTDVFPSWFFFKTCDASKHFGTSQNRLGTNLGNSKLKVFLRDMLSSLAQRIHSCSNSHE